MSWSVHKKNANLQKRLAVMQDCHTRSSPQRKIYSNQRNQNVNSAGAAKPGSSGAAASKIGRPLT
jgi:hypothetical protein